VSIRAIDLIGVTSTVGHGAPFFPPGLFQMCVPFVKTVGVQPNYLTQITVRPLAINTQIFLSPSTSRKNEVFPKFHLATA